ncbi:rho-associated coiled-coil containing protein kinase [Encephalitozoon intestinalis ATCC 50506]|uniref:non-specific serine/threonine protein kinase n=1 Tax=Encephalitozoon intestinalis (strain ATCC 50506) TaxID=876142 RepID=E0S5K2_ENCIT|nr:rho-associated coiled-coil containing protein kinase [Encephalitozoon intestinalis ATCC 50506]ADM10987.1 rho-associated coiled-coil containing protein kinase [Encephalitozoon intestinalis ATCC 50506]UTX44624.1 protein kinase [Encephalitozoon intestinalis]
MERERINIIGDCLEAVYHEVSGKGTGAPLERIKEIVRAKTKPSDYEIIKNVAKGGYGEVFLVKREKIYAMKRVSKELVLRQPHTALFMAEKEAMVDCIGSEWLVCAHMTMQDEEYLYYLMDFIPGGDFMGLLSKEDVLEEDWVRFYTAEIVAALDELHKLGWIHRDLKPDNVLIGIDGHVKLADFGSCIKMRDGKARSSITVGTPDYVSPDVLCSVNEECEYEEDVDFWTLGVIIYEMIYGTTPFYSDTLMETYRRITKVEFGFPFKVSPELTSLIKSLITTKDKRMKINEIKSHAFFKGIDWDRLKELKPPFVPEISGDSDTSHFVDTQFDPEKRKPDVKGNYMPFVGFTFDPEFVSKFSVMMEKEMDRASNELELKVREHEGTLENLLIKISENKRLIDLQSQELTGTKAELENAKIKLEDSKGEIQKHQKELKEVLTELLAEKEELEEAKTELERYKKWLKGITEEVNSKDFLSEEYSIAEKMPENVDRLLGSIESLGKKDVLIKDLSSSIHEARRETEEIMDIFGNLQESMNKLIIENKGLKSEIEIYREKCQEILRMRATLESENKILTEKLKSEGLDSLKRQLRLKATEIKEYEQKLNQEILLRKSVEEELNFLKKERTKVHRVAGKQSFSCHLLNGESTIVRVEEDHLWVGEERHYISNVYVGELRPNELHHLPQKKIPMTLKIIFMNEEVKSVSSAGRRSLKSLEEDLNTEIAIKEGIEKIRTLLQGKTLEEANMQLEGSNRKISQLKAEIERSRKSTIEESIPDDPVKIYEFNNHLFASKTLPQGSLCDFCNEVLYGLVNQGFECRDCKMIVHKSCYVLGDVSCELYSALKTGKTYYVTMRTIEEKDKLLGISKGY